MDVRLFWLQQACSESVVMKTRSMKPWGLVLEFFCDPFCFMYSRVSLCHLQIEVLLPTKQRVEGTLQHYNLHYNIALVSVKGFLASHPAKIQHLWNDHSCDVVAVGYCFKSGKLMAARGRQFGRPATLDCKYLRYSTCKITKVGCYFSYILLFRVYTRGP